MTSGSSSTQYEAGKISVHSFYTEAEIAQNEHLAAAQGVFYQGDPDKPVAIVAAGGAFTSVCSDVEGFPFAMELHKQGYNVMVLRYRVGEQLSYDGAMDMAGIEASKDLRRTVEYLCKKQEELNIDMEGYTLFGSSAGGMLIATYALTEGAGSFEEMGLPKPATINLVYGLSDGLMPADANKDIGIFAIVGENDEIFNAESMGVTVDALKTAVGEEYVSFTVYENFPHGSGVGIGTDGEGWIANAVAFWEAHR